jgi:hypothetical protein
MCDYFKQNNITKPNSTYYVTYENTQLTNLDNIKNISLINRICLDIYFGCYNPQEIKFVYKKNDIELLDFTTEYDNLDFDSQLKNNKEFSFNVGSYSNYIFDLEFFDGSKFIANSNKGSIKDSKNPKITGTYDFKKILLTEKYDHIEHNIAYNNIKDSKIQFLILDKINITYPFLEVFDIDPKKIGKLLISCKYNYYEKKKLEKLAIKKDFMNGKINDLIKKYINVSFSLDNFFKFFIVKDQFKSYFLDDICDIRWHNTNIYFELQSSHTNCKTCEHENDCYDSFDLYDCCEIHNKIRYKQSSVSLSNLQYDLSENDKIMKYVVNRCYELLYQKYVGTNNGWYGYTNYVYNNYILILKRDNKYMKLHYCIDDASCAGFNFVITTRVYDSLELVWNKLKSSEKNAIMKKTLYESNFNIVKSVQANQLMKVSF